MNIHRAIIISGIVCFLALGVKPGAAQTAEEMLSACRAVNSAKISNGQILLPQDFESGECWGAFGMLHSLVYLLGEDHKPILHACVPLDATRTELIAIFVSYIEKHPEEYTHEFSLVAINSILTVYPCSKKKE